MHINIKASKLRDECVNSVIESLPTMCRALDLILCAEKPKVRKLKICQYIRLCTMTKWYLAHLSKDNLIQKIK